MNETLTANRESLPVRCEVCHQTDLFNPETGICQRCSPTSAEVARRGRSSVTGAHEIPTEFREVFSEVVGREQVLWVGRPDPETARRRGVGMYLLGGFVGLMGGGFFIAAVVANIQTWRGVDSLLFFRVFLILLPLLITVFWWMKIRQRQLAVGRTLYVLTDQRALILISDKKSAFRSFELNSDDLWAGSFNIPENSRMGGVIFEKRWKIFETPYDWDQYKVGYRRYGIGFLCIEEFREVEKLVRKLANSKQTR